MDVSDDWSVQVIFLCAGTPRTARSGVLWVESFAISLQSIQTDEVEMAN
jgi:hypothetical protein